MKDYETSLDYATAIEKLEYYQTLVKTRTALASHFEQDLETAAAESIRQDFAEHGDVNPDAEIIKNVAKFICNQHYLQNELPSFEKVLGEQIKRGHTAGYKMTWLTSRASELYNAKNSQEGLVQELTSITDEMEEILHEFPRLNTAQTESSLYQCYTKLYFNAAFSGKEDQATIFHAKIQLNKGSKAQKSSTSNDQDTNIRSEARVAEESDSAVTTNPAASSTEAKVVLNADSSHHTSSYSNSNAGLIVSSDRPTKPTRPTQKVNISAAINVSNTTTISESRTLEVEVDTSVAEASPDPVIEAPDTELGGEIVS